MNILISNDHAGVELKNAVNSFLKNNGYVVENLGDNFGRALIIRILFIHLQRKFLIIKTKKELLCVEQETA